MHSGYTGRKYMPNQTSKELFSKALAAEKKANKVDENVDFHGAVKLYKEANGWLAMAVDAETVEKTA